MIKPILVLFVLFFFTPVWSIYGQWENLNSGIDDDLTGVVFLEDVGVVTGENGLYYTLNGGIGAANWQRFEITDNTENLTLYENTKFNSCFINPNLTAGDFTVYAVGKDLVNNRAVIMSIDFPSLEYGIVSLDIENSGLNDITYTNNYGRFYAVGDNGLILYFTDSVGGYNVVNSGPITEDLTSIHISGFRGFIGAHGKYFRIITSSHALTPYSTPNVIHNDIAYAGDSNAYSVNENYIRYSFGNPFVLSQYDYGPLNGNTILWNAGRYFIGTDHGIFISDTSRTILEWQPSSDSNNIKSFWSSNSNSHMYACGVNGVILKNIAPTSEAQPYVRIDFNGTCFSSASTNVSATVGSSTSCMWYIDGNYIGSSCNSINHLFPNVGTYQVKLTVEFNGLITERVKDIHIVNSPEIDKQISILDNILCHEEPLTIEIMESEQDVVYTLHKVGSSEVYGESEVGNGNTILFQTGPISETGTFYLRSTNALAPSCSNSWFPNTFDITVEQTTSNFHSDLINAALGEDVNFYETSSEANSFLWTFPTSGNINSSMEPNVTNFFNSEGVFDITLVSESANSCLDEVTLNSPNIYVEPGEILDCWSYLHQGEEVPWSGSTPNDITHSSKVSDGYLTGGYYYNESFGSNFGEPFAFDDAHGAYLTKHDQNGTLKWIVYSIVPGSNGSIITSSAEDSNGNIYLTLLGEGTFYDNSGKSKYLSNDGNIIKLDSRGKLIWHMEILNCFPRTLIVDNNDDLVVLAGYDRYNDFQHYVRLNGAIIGEVGQTVFEDLPSNTGSGVIKLSSDGSVIWDFEVFRETITSVAAPLRHIQVDSNNNYYIEGTYNHNLYIYPVGSDTSTHLSFHQAQSTGSWYTYLMKISPNGALEWTTRSYTIENNHYNLVDVQDIKTDSDGNTFITGRNDYYNFNFNQVHYVENSDGSVLSNDEVKNYFLQKINAEGYCEWVVGATEEDILPAYPTGQKISLSSGKINVLGYARFTGPNTYDVEFGSLNNENNILVPLSNTNIFINSYESTGLLSQVSIYQDDTNVRDIRGFFDLGIDRFLLAENIDFSSSTEITKGRVSLLNSSCLAPYNGNLSLANYLDPMEVFIYPNPNNGKFTIDFGAFYNSVDVNIYNILGEKVFQNDYLNQSGLSIEFDGNNGVYFIEVVLNGKLKFYKKIVYK